MVPAIVCGLLASLASQRLSAEGNFTYAMLALDNIRRADRVDGLVRVAAAGLTVPGRRVGAELAVKLLGRARDERAIPFLVKNLAYRSVQAEERIRVRMIGPETVYPCMGSLARIGGPAVNPVVAAAEATDDRQFHQNAAIVVVHALGAELAAEYLARRAAKLPAGDARRRVEAVRTHLRGAAIVSDAGFGETLGDTTTREPPKP